MTKFAVLVDNLANTKQSMEQYLIGAANLKKLFKKVESEIALVKKHRKELHRSGFTTKYVDKFYREKVEELQNVKTRYYNIRDRGIDCTVLAYELEILFKKANISSCNTES